MPYKLRGKCVVRADTGAVVKCHPDEEQARKHLAALKVNVQESGPLRGLLEGFSVDPGPVVLDGRMRPGDRVRVDVKGAESIVGRMVRPSDRKPGTHVLVAPEGGGPHVEAAVKSVRHDTPEEQAAERARRQAEMETERQLQAPPPGERPAPPGASPAVQTERALRGMGKGSVRLQPEAQRERARHGGKVLEALLQEFNPSEARGPHGRWIKIASQLRKLGTGDSAHVGGEHVGKTNVGFYTEGGSGTHLGLTPEGTTVALAKRAGAALSVRDLTGGVSGVAQTSGERRRAAAAARMERMRGNAISAGARPAGETTAQEIARKSPGAQAELDRHRSVLAGARSAAATPVAPKLNTAAQAVQARIDAEHQLAAITYGQRTLDYVMGVKDERGVKIMPWSLPPGVTMRSRYGGERQGTRTDAGQWSAAQWSAALEAAAKLGHAVENPDIHDAANSVSDRRRTLAALAAAKKEAEKRLKDAKAAVKAHGNTKQLRLALAEALRRYPRGVLAEMFGAELVAGVLQEEARGAGIGALLEGFSVGYSASAASRRPTAAAAAPPPTMPAGRGSITAPAETPAQSRARAAGMVASAKAGISDFNAKHPRGGHGRFSKKGGAAAAAKSSTSSRSGTRASRATPGGSRILSVGSKGTLVRSIQRQLHLPATGTFDARTQAAITRYQRQHGLLVDGKVGAQTIASLRGNPNARRVKPGPIPASTARVHNPRSSTSKSKAKPKAKKVAAPVRMGGGVVL